MNISKTNKYLFIIAQGGPSLKKSLFMEQLDERCIFEASFLAKAFVIILFFLQHIIYVYYCIWSFSICGTFAK